MNQGFGSALCIASWLDAVTLERFDHGIGIEVVHVHTEVVDAAARHRSRGGASISASATGPAAEHDELDAVIETEQRSIRSLGRLHSQTEKFLIELVRPCRVRYEIRAMTPALKSKQAFFR